jgi:hypothetical protein
MSLKKWAKVIEQRAQKREVVVCPTTRRGRVSRRKKKIMKRVFRPHLFLPARSDAKFLDAESIMRLTGDCNCY